jgi:hypothetical protein
MLVWKTQKSRDKKGYFANKWEEKPDVRILRLTIQHGKN